MKKLTLKNDQVEQFNEFLLSKIQSNDLTFQEIVNKYKANLRLLLSNTELFLKLAENNNLSQENIEYLLNNINQFSEIRAVYENLPLIECFIDSSVVAFKKIIDQTTKFDCFDHLLFNKEIFEKLIENDKLKIEDLKGLLSRIETPLELKSLSKNTPLLKKLFNDFLFDVENINALNMIISTIRCNWCNDWIKNLDIHTVFDLFRFWNESNKEISKLIDLRQILYEFETKFGFSFEQSLKLYENLKNNTTAQNKLKELVQSNLESNCNFEELMQYLNKKEKKKTLGI